MNAMKFQQASPAIYAEFVCAMTMTMLHLDSHEQQLQNFFLSGPILLHILEDRSLQNGDACFQSTITDFVFATLEEPAY